MKNFKRITLASVIVLAGALLLTGCNQGAGKAGTVDMMQLMQSPELKNISQTMMTQDKGSQAELKAAYDAMQAANSTAQKATGSAKTAAEAKAKAAQAKFSGLMASFQKQQQSQQTQLKTDVTAAISSVAKSKGLSVVYVKQAVLYGNDEDITKDVIDQLQKDKS